MTLISIHALLAESDNLRVVDGSKSSIISIHALLAESDKPSTFAVTETIISIHALLAESDTWQRGSRITYVISIHALLAESDHSKDIDQPEQTKFLSTLSLRRATNSCTQAVPLKSISIHALLAESDVLWVLRKVPILDFYPRSPCGERPAVGR